MCLNRDWFSSFEKLDECFTVMGDDHPYNVEGICTVHIKIFDKIVWELKEVCTLTQKKSYLSWWFENVGSCGIIRDGVLKITKGSMVVMKGVRQNNLYYLKVSIVTGQVKTSIFSDDICTQVWQMTLRHGGEKFLQAQWLYSKIIFLSSLFHIYPWSFLYELMLLISFFDYGV